MCALEMIIRGYFSCSLLVYLRCSNDGCLAHHYEQDERGGYNHSFQSEEEAIAALNKSIAHAYCPSVKKYAVKIRGTKTTLCVAFENAAIPDAIVDFEFGGKWSALLRYELKTIYRPTAVGKSRYQTKRRAESVVLMFEQDNDLVRLLLSDLLPHSAIIKQWVVK